MCHFDSFGQFFPELVNKLQSLTAEKEGSDGQRKFMKRHIFYLFPPACLHFSPYYPLALRFAEREICSMFLWSIMNIFIFSSSVMLRELSIPSFGQCLAEFEDGSDF